ncbi:MAG: hypothetical protein A4E63_02789 [Syntrophorhabdus sp. PtaU1.Bin050]|nr:MAG: hypothetical protein A4E63_02789 [Syntrophorhabdus sp. PtaU1.Bin050]
MEERFLKAGWAKGQPGRAIFLLVVTLLMSFVICAAQSIRMFGDQFGMQVMCMIPMAFMLGSFQVGKVIGGEYVPQPLKGAALMVFTGFYAVLVDLAMIRFLGGGVLHPYVALTTVTAIVTIFFLGLAFDFWPFNKLSLPAGIFLCILTAYVIGWIAMRFSNFSVLSFIPGAPGPVPFYKEGGPFANMVAPFGPVLWERAAAYTIWCVTWLWIFTCIGRWPFSKTKMKQPLFGIVFVIVIMLLAWISMLIAVNGMGMEPLKFNMYGIIIVFGILMMLLIFQAWPGRLISSPLAGGFINLILAIVLGFIGMAFFGSFFEWHFGKAYVYPDNIFTMNTFMLGLLFPMWAMYADFFEFWPLPPLPPPPAPPSDT